MKDLEKEAQEWLAKHAVLLGPEELLFEEEKCEKVLRTKDGQWPVPYMVPHMGIFIEIKDAESFNRIVGDPQNWSIILGRTDLYHAWIVPQAIVIFGQTWFNHKQWGSHMRPGPPPSLFDSDDRRAARKAGTSMANTSVGRSVILRIVSKTEHALDMYLSGGGRAKNGAIKKPGGYIVRSIANEFIQDAGSDMGYHMVRVRACPNCLATKRGRARRSEVKHVRDNIYACERCIENARNLTLTITRFQEAQTPILSRFITEHRRAVQFSEFSGMVCICPNSACQGRFVPLDSIEDSTWWLTPEGIKASEAILQMRPLRGTQQFREPLESLKMLPLCCPFCNEHFTPATALIAQSGFHGKSGKFTGLPSMLVWVRSLDNMRVSGSGNGKHEVDLTKLKGGLVDDSNIDPSRHIVAKQRTHLLIGELAIQAQKLGNKSTLSIISHCFYEAVAQWMFNYPEDASSYFFNWTASERASTEIERNRVPNCNTKKTTMVVKGQETAIHQTILYIWLGKISKHMREIRRVKESKIQSLEDLKWFCRPPTYNGGPKVSFITTVDDGLRVPNVSKLTITNGSIDKPRMAWVLSVRKINSNESLGIELIQHIRVCEWQGVIMSEESGLKPGDSVKIIALMMPGHHCHAPIQRIIRLRTSLLSPMIDRIKTEESGETSDITFWQDWNKRADIARKATGIGI
jgi:hypothetical protein